MKKNRVETLPLSTRKLPDFVTIFGDNELAAGVAAATVQKCRFRNWLRLVGRRHDVQLWTEPPVTYYAQNKDLTRVYNPVEGVNGGLLITEVRVWFLVLVACPCSFVLCLVAVFVVC